MKIEDIEVNVQVDDTSLTEYNVLPGAKGASCYIASEAGKLFELSVTNNLKEDIQFLVFLDGKYADNRIVYAGGTAVMKGAHIDDEIVRTFAFGVLKLTDDETALFPAAADLEALGTIRVDILRVICGENTTFKPRDYGEFDNSGALHERTKKAGAHHVELSNAIKAKTSTFYVDLLDPKEKPYISFVYRYRPMEMLAAQGVLPLEQRAALLDERQRFSGQEADLARNNLPRVEGGPPQHVNDPQVKQEDIDEMRAELQALTARIRAAEEGRVKREPSPIVLGSGHGEVIDLTLD